MKKLLLILFLFTGYTSFSQGKIGGEGNVIPTGNYPIVASKDIKGGLHKFQTIAERNALPANFKDSGMLAYVTDSLKYYKWNGADWEEFKTGSDAPTDYFTSYTQASDSSYLQTNRKDGTKQYVVIQADGLTGEGGGGVGGSYQLPYNGNATDYLGGDTVYHALPSNPSLQDVFNQSVDNEDDPIIDGDGNNLTIDHAVIQLNDAAGVSSINANNRILTNSFGEDVVNWSGTDIASPIIIKTETIFSKSNGDAVFDIYPDGNVVHLFNSDLYFDANGSTAIISSSNVNNSYTLQLPQVTSNIEAVVPVSVNGQFADVNGNIKTIDSTVTLTSGTITVSDSRVHTGARIFVSVNTPSGTQGFLSAKTSDIVDGTSFIINSTSATDNSTVNYEIINP